jgi:hypothetical protein
MVDGLYTPIRNRTKKTSSNCFKWSGEGTGGELMGAM